MIVCVCEFVCVFGSNDKNMRLKSINFRLCLLQINLFVYMNVYFRLLNIVSIQCPLVGRFPIHNETKNVARQSSLFTCTITTLNGKTENKN